MVALKKFKNHPRQALCHWVYQPSKEHTLHPEESQRKTWSGR